MNKNLAFFILSLCVGMIIGSFVGTKSIEGIKKEKEIEVEFDVVAKKYLKEYGGIGTEDMSDLFKNYPDLASWPDFHGSIDMSDLFEESEK